MATLRAITRELIAQAKLHPCAAHAKQLPRGLWVAVRIDDPADRQLKLERKGVYPADIEWQTVLAHWPEPVPEGITPTRYKSGPRYALVGRWKAPQAELFTERKSDE